MLALAIFLVTLILVIWQPRLPGQPRGLGIGWSALGGAGVAWAAGVIHARDIPVVWHIVWNATFTFIALIVISLLLDRAGFFQWAALHIARWGGGRGRVLFPLVVGLGAATAAIFANDGAALLLTPIVIAILASLRLSHAASLAFVIATGFVADTTSLPLVISNLVNIVSAGFFAVPFDRYAAVMVPVDMVSLAATFGVLWLYFRRDIPRHYAVATLPEPAGAIRDPMVFRAAFPLLAALLVAYFVTAPFHIPVCVVAGLAALVLLALAAGGRVIPVRAVLWGAPWQIVLFSLGMYLVVYGLRNAGLTAHVADALVWLGHRGTIVATLGTGVLAALLSSGLNNMPSVLVGALAIQQAQDIAPQTRELMVYANIVGCDLGPKFTPIGSLATLLWLHVLAGKGLRIGWGQYMRVGLAITPPVLLAALLALAVWLPVL
ncbi:Arsenical pump membrane protein [Gluconacetobacter diazotrophicus PA1 5]|uniref:Arsenical pump membrane protein n=1 Tax=Gluconacetobacter diazotrophicus (strain ATCC 49037 / DSM 5601 / CCUG 37298 / CIP 103539 / LMG 7603 / PAl5) TaxID=272568 RepID=A9H746_GLUDA|nr:arsenic transporter [Gluconacetobacter diazotrophicus]ACI52279.1 Arsenical pump membrane protein [Gluconacetobacter diazotrophicus PA1 5]TWB04826.1 arsenite efflux membrane protein ArsB [Gluconacetobacter diazotrophicus]CAP57593.1 Arsenical pump membrane protein [Gluconacetobacter diazotrophicus PA1 5]